jgi:hypothetical protein
MSAPSTVRLSDQAREHQGRRAGHTVPVYLAIDRQTAKYLQRKAQYHQRLAERHETTPGVIEHAHRTNKTIAQAREDIHGKRAEAA